MRFMNRSTRPNDYSSTLEKLEPRAMLAGLTPTVGGGAGQVIPALMVGLSGPPGIILPSTNAAFTAASASPSPIMAPGAAGSAGASATGALSIPSSVGPPSTSANELPPLAVTGSGGIAPVLYDASQTGVSSAVIHPLMLTESPLRPEDGVPEARMTPLVLHPGNDAAPQIVLAVWIAEGATVLLVGDREGNEAITAPTVGDGIEAQLTGGALPNSQAASDSSGVELEPKVAAQILAALSRGDIQLAMELLAGIGAKGANLAPKFLEKIQGLHKIGDGQCEDIASRTAAVFRAMGDSPVILKVVDGKGSRIWHFGGEMMTNKGFHEVTKNTGRIYDHLTGPAGMPLDDYLRLLRTAVGITPELLPR
jgi:hypothetical protein